MNINLFVVDEKLVKFEPLTSLAPLAAQRPRREPDGSSGGARLELRTSLDGARSVRIKGRNIFGGMDSMSL